MPQKRLISRYIPPIKSVRAIINKSTIVLLCICPSYNLLHAVYLVCLLISLDPCADVSST